MLQAVTWRWCGCCVRRHVLKPQPLLDYSQGGHSGLGFKRCIGELAVPLMQQPRPKQHACSTNCCTTGLYRFHNNSHVEAACNEVGGRAWRLLRTWKCAKHLLASYGL